MPERASQELIASLERLGLARPTHVAQMSRRVRRLARDLPVFDSVWIDALAQARVLTPFQAAEWHAGRAESLRVGPYVLCDRLSHPLYVRCYRARNVETHEFVRLAVLEKADSRIAAGLEALRASEPYTASVRADAASDDPATSQGLPHLPAPRSPLPSPLFLAAPWIEGRSAAEWIAHHGRLAPEVVLHIAQCMAIALAELETHKLSHTDISIASLLLIDSGEVHLVFPGLRGLLRPEEGYAHADLPPEAYETLAPERVVGSCPPNSASEVYACGCVWWQLLCGRPPLLGGDALAKLRAAQMADICDPSRYVLNIPEPLATTIADCLQRNPGRRPKSMAQLLQMLGPPSQEGRQALADCLALAARPAVQWSAAVRRVRKSSRTPIWLAAATCLLATVVALWPTWKEWSLPVFSASTRSAKNQLARQPSKKTQQADGKTLRTTQRAAAPRDTQRSGDNRVSQASYLVLEPTPDELVLATDKPLELTSLSLQDGQRVRAANGGRATIRVPKSGLVVDRKNVQFENIDFVWNGTPSSENLRRSPPAVVVLRASQVEFRCCSFICTHPAPAELAAIRWMYPPDRSQAATMLPSGVVRLVDCLLQGDLAGVECQVVGAARIELANILHLGNRPLVTIDHCPAADEVVSLNLAQSTLRGGPVLECQRSCAQRAGEIAISATACVFAPRSNQPLVRFTDVKALESFVTALRWTGQGSLVLPQVNVLTYATEGRHEKAVDEASLAIAGLVRSHVRFAGQTDDPAANEVLDWQAPLQSTNPPGINPQTLPSGKRL